MNSISGPGLVRPKSRILTLARYLPLTVGLVAIVVTYISATTLSGVWRWAVVAIAAASFVIACLFAPATMATEIAPASDSSKGEGLEDGLEDRLVALDEANEFFGTSLNAADMFRLVSSRVVEIFPFAGSALLVPAEGEHGMKFLHFDGDNADSFADLEIAGFGSLAGRASRSGEMVIENDLTQEAEALGESRLAGFKASVAIPLSQGDSTFGVFQIFTKAPVSDGYDTRKMFEAISEHVTPIFKNSLEFERSLSSALTDSITGLPNERAFYMILENQLAESIRHRDERPLTVLSIDIRDFGAVNSMLGHGIGDRMLEFAGARISEHLRKMDFLARTVNDEFGVILPTATEKKAQEVIARIREGFSRVEFDIAEGEGVFVELNIGWATFWKDGETADQLLRAAQQRKRLAKSEAPASVLWFPKEYVN